MVKRESARLEKPEKQLILRGRILDAMDNYIKRTGETLGRARNIVFDWLGSREAKRMN
ncbi:MAG: hypothetical protein ACYS8W_14450 [Planctomycetota bacterium]|jgi:hypothetical protein